jgi:hypothetical protein
MVSFRDYYESVPRLSKTPCPRCGCLAVRLFECDCGEAHSDYCVNCGRFTSLSPTSHIDLADGLYARCEQGAVPHDHPAAEQEARLDAYLKKISAADMERERN